MRQLDPRKLVFIDETWIKTNMAPLRGWGPKGKRLHGFAPHGHWNTMTFIAYPSGASAFDDYSGVQFQGMSSSMRLIL